jgi:hypothetical protein
LRISEAAGKNKFFPKKITEMKKLLVKTIPGIINYSYRRAFYNAGKKVGKNCFACQAAGVPGDAYG